MELTSGSEKAESTQHQAWLQAARSQGFLNCLPDPVVDELLMGSRRVQIPAGSVLTRWEDSPGPAVVLKGSLRIFVSAPDGAQFTLRYLRVGDLLGWTNLRMPRGVSALEESELLLLDPSRQSALAESDPVVAAALRAETRRGLDDLLRMTCIRVFCPMRARVANAIVMQARAAGTFAPGSQVLGTQEELANAVGSVREVVAAALHDLKRDGLIAVQRGSVIILKPQLLELEAGGGLGLGPAGWP